MAFFTFFGSKSPFSNYTDTILKHRDFEFYFERTSPVQREIIRRIERFLKVILINPPPTFFLIALKVFIPVGHSSSYFLPFEFARGLLNFLSDRNVHRRYFFHVCV